MRTSKLLLKETRGSVLALVTISMVVLVSFSAGVMDIGQMYETRRQLQNGADGAALAGAQLLATTGSDVQAINAALDYAQRNGVTTSQVDPTYPMVTSEGPYLNNAVKMSASRHLNLLVAGLLGNGAGNVNATAEAVIAPMLPTEGLWPWATPQSAVLPGQLVNLKTGAPPPAAGNFNLIDYPAIGGGSSDYLEQIKYGYGQNPSDYISPSLPWDIPTLTGNNVGSTLAGIDYLIAMAASTGQDDINSGWNQPVNSCTWPDAPKTVSDPNVPPPASFVGNASQCYRIGVIPIIEQYAETGASTGVRITGWAAFYINGYGNGPGGLKYIWGYFLNKALITGGRTNWGAPLTGLIGVRLWQ